MKVLMIVVFAMIGMDSETFVLLVVVQSSVNHSPH